MSVGMLHRARYLAIGEDILILTRSTTIFKTNPVSFRVSGVAMSGLDLEGLVLRLLAAELIVEVEERGFNLEGIMRTMMK